ncbi:hypothetical protein FACS1894145_4610 [Bacteroidia bacterium]|nr:hypothetical protein FACS1894145_4610 [Bacteroidia bacterium]
MDINQVNFWLSANADKFSSAALPVIRAKLEQMDNNQLMMLQSADFKKPSTILLIAILLGWERFFIDSIGLGIVKVVTGYGCGIWWLIDIFSAKKRTKAYNLKEFQKITGMMGGTMHPFSAPTTDSAPQPQIVAETIIENTEMQQQQQYFDSPVNTGDHTFAEQKMSSPVMERIKLLFTSPKAMWKKIDSDNSSQIGYMALLSVVPAAALFLSFFARGIYYAISIPYGGGQVLGYMLIYGFVAAITTYAVLMVLAFLSALFPFLLAGKFDSVSSYNKAIALTVSAMTPLCLLGILLLFSTSFLFWIWLAVGIIYGRYLIYSGTRTLLKTPLEKHTLYVGICADVFMALTIVFTLLLFAELMAFSAPGFSHTYPY